MKPSLRHFVIPLTGYIPISMTRFSIAVVLPEISKDLELSSIQAGSLFTAFFMANAAIILYAGHISDKIGRKRPLALGLTLFGLGVLFTALASKYIFVLAYLALAGLGWGIIAPSLYALMGDLLPGRRGFSTSLAASVYYSAGFIGPWLTGVFAILYGWRFSFYVFGLWSLCMAVILLLLFKEPRIPKSNSNRKTPFHKLNTQNVFIICLTMLIFTFAYSAVASWTPTFIRHVHGLDVAQSGLLFGLFLLAGGAGTVLLGTLSDKAGRKAICVSSGILAAFLSFLIYGYLFEILVLAIAMVLFGLLLNPYWSLQIAYAQDSVVPEVSGLSTGLVQTLGTIGAGFGPVCAGILIDSTDITFAILYSASFPLLVGGLLLLAGRNTPLSSR